MLETFPPQLGDSTAEGLHITCHISGFTSCYWLHTNSFTCWLNPPAAKLSYQYADIGKFSPVIATHCWPVSCEQTFKPAVVGHSLQSWPWSTNSTLPLLVCSLGWSIKVNQSTSNVLIIRKTSTDKTVLLSSLLTIFARLQKEQYLRFLCCHTTATFRAPVCQQWRLNSCTVAFWTHCWKRFHHC